MNIKQWIQRKHIKFLLRSGNYYKASEILDKLKDKTESEKQLADIIRPHWTEEQIEIIKSVEGPAISFLPITNTIEYLNSLSKADIIK